MDLKKQDIIIEIGKQWIRIGLVGDRTPRKSFPTNSLIPSNHQQGTQYDIKIQQSLYTIFFSYINCSCQNKTVIILQNVFTQRRILQSMARVMFKKLKIQKLQLALTCITPLYLTASYSGIVIMSGSSCTQIMPVFQSYPLFKHFKYRNVGTTTGNKRIRDQMALLNSQFKSQMFADMQDSYINQLRILHSCIPCQSDIINVTFKRIKLKFDPKVIDFSQLFGNVEEEEFNIAYAFVQMLNELSVETLEMVCSNIVFAGGLWRVKGMQNYFKKSVSKILKQKQFKKLMVLNISKKLKFVEWGLNPSQVSWIGCSVGASVRSVQHLSLKRSEYNELGFTQKIMQNYFNSV